MILNDFEKKERKFTVSVDYEHYDLTDSVSVKLCLKCYAECIALHNSFRFKVRWNVHQHLQAFG